MKNSLETGDRGHALRRGLIFALVAACLWSGSALAQDPQPAGRGDARIAAALEKIRETHGIPALAGAIVTEDGLAAAGAAGVRKAGTDVAVTAGDRWHLGSDTKAMTATLIGALVEQKRLDWGTTLEEFFPDLAAGFPDALRGVTLLHLLSHRAGLPANLPWFALAKPERSLPEQRLEAVRQLAQVKLQSEPGSAYLYSNLGYVVAGAIAEKTMGEPWEELMARFVFGPLGLAETGFGGVGTPGVIDQPWGHTPDGKAAPANGPAVDNPAVLGPAGTVHATLADWARFVADQIRGGRNGKGLLTPQTYARLHNPPFGGDYALGWLRVERDWAGGTVLTHSGSNTMNYAVVWLKPSARGDAVGTGSPGGRVPPAGFAVLVVTNQGGETAAKACDEAAGALIKIHLAGPGE